MPIVFSAIIPHPPLAIPSIGKDNVKHLKKTLNSFEKIEQDLYASKPDAIIIISPHGKIIQDSINVNLYPEYTGSFEEFGDFSSKLMLKSDPKVDYGISIPLYFLLQHMKNTPIIPITPSTMDLKTHYKVGMLLQRVISRINKRFAIICSAELSHRLTKDAPGGFSDQGEIFDKSFIELLKKHDTKGILHFNPDLGEEASECCLKAVSIAKGIMMGMKYHMEILSYEFPYGVGYLAAE